jgi:hypothetical protein
VICLRGKLPHSTDVSNLFFGRVEIKNANTNSVPCDSHDASSMFAKHAGVDQAEYSLQDFNREMNNKPHMHHKLTLDNVIIKLYNSPINKIIILYQ